MKFIFNLLLFLFNLNLVVAQPTIQPDMNDMGADTTLNIINEYLSKLAIEMESWSAEEIKQNKETFIHKRGHIKIPEKTNFTDLKLESGCSYFKLVSSSKYPLIVREPVKNSYIYATIGFVDSIPNKAFKNGLPFTGIAEYINPNGDTLGLYAFADGFVERIYEFTSKGNLIKIMQYKKGLAHGECKEFNLDGSLRFLYTYKDGKKDGNFYTVYYTDDPRCRTSITEGYYNCGEEVVLRKHCN